jgi:hypothetical protein
MKKLDPVRILKGKKRLYIALGLLIAANVASLALNLSQNGLESTERLLLSRTALVIVASLGILRGSQPIQRVLQVVLVIGAAGSAYLLTQGRAGVAEYSIFLPDIILGLGVAALLQFDSLVRDFLTYQRSQHYGTRVSIGADGSSITSGKQSKAKKEDKDEWESIDDLYEDEPEN